MYSRLLYFSIDKFKFLLNLRCHFLSSFRKKVHYLGQQRISKYLALPYTHPTKFSFLYRASSGGRPIPIKKSYTAGSVVYKFYILVEVF